MSDSNAPVPAPDPAAPMAPTPEASLEVLGLLVCRELQNGRSGVSLREVVEIVPVLQFPGEAGPLAFVAFVRPLRAGEAAVSFRVHPMQDPSQTVVQLPGRLTVQKGYEGRQTVVSAGFKTLQVKAGGWFGLEFRLGERVLARTRFAVGAIGKPKEPAAGA
ncbi:MAG: hypothetical protein IT460_13950 [Planctomycetes bacterium]|nr:hypothetical protein [Planctomycetota bacterium]